MAEKSLKHYLGLPKNKILRFKFKGEFIYARPLSIGGFDAPTPTPQVNENIGTFLRIKDIDIYKTAPAITDNLEHFTVYSNQIESDIEIVDIETT